MPRSKTLRVVVAREGIEVRRPEVARIFVDKKFDERGNYIEGSGRDVSVLRFGEDPCEVENNSYYRRRITAGELRDVDGGALVEE